MKERIIGWCWALWAISTFSLSFLGLYIPLMLTWLIPDPKGQTLFIAISRGWIRVWLWLVRCPLRVEGLTNFVKGQSYIITCNHNSFLDPPLSSPFIPGANKTIAKSSFTKIPLFNFFYRKGAVLVDRSSEQSRSESYREMKAVLQKGMHMCIYPEGTRNRTDNPLKSFHDGAFRLALDTGHAILPAVLLHTKKVLPPDKKFYFRPGPVAIHFLSPITPAGHTLSSLKEKVFSVMKEYYVKNSS